MKITLLAVLICIFLCNCVCLAQTSKQIVQLHQIPSNIQTLHLQLPSSKIKIVKTKSSRISIETTIDLDAGTPPLLDYLIKSGRYDLQIKTDSTTSAMTLFLPKQSKILVIKGNTCEESISYIVHVPEYLSEVTTSYSKLSIALSE